MHRRIVFFCFMVFAIHKIEAQISEGGLPPSFNFESSLKSQVSATQIPVLFNVSDLLAVDAWQVSNGAPLAVATSIPVSINTSNAGNWLTLPDGQEIWQFRLQAKGAIALMLYYKRFEIPQGGKLFIYNADKTHILGSYTHRTNPRGGRFATEFVAGDDLTLEYVSPASGERPQIEIEEVGYGYNHLSILVGNELRSSGTCQVNINCIEGAAWQKEKAGVCHTIQKIGSKSYICSGSLVNNTAQDFKPYILMANHCMEVTEFGSNTQSTPEELMQWVFYFHYERLGCTDSQLAQVKTMVGCKKVASTPIDGGGDGLLLLLNQEIPESYKVYYNGWDRTNNPATSGVGIHHPRGDYKKISTFTNKASSTTWRETIGATGARNAYWDVRFTATENGHGIVEGGSSGSPLFNQNHLIVGTLTGGASSCLMPEQENIYSKLYYNWDKHGTADSSRMDIWLDPRKTNVETLKGISRTVSMPAPSNLSLEYMDNNVELNWNEPNTAIKPTHYNIYRSNQLIATSTETTYTDELVSLLGEVIYGITAEYPDFSESDPLTGSIIIRDYKSPSELNVTIKNQVATLEWEAPVYQQAISWSTGSPSLLVGAGVPIYIGQLWDKEDIKSIVNNPITAVEFFAYKNVDYTLLVAQGDNEYRQKVPVQRDSEIRSIELDTPFVITAGQELLVGIFADSNDPDIYPLALDGGPATIGKGNLISEDGETWYVLYDGKTSDEEDFDNNFYIAAIVTSEQSVTRKMTTNTQQNSSLGRYTSPLKQQYNPKSSFKLSSLSSFRSSTTLATQLQYPAAFPRIKGYKIYRNLQPLAQVPLEQLSYVDHFTEELFMYGVSTIYEEGKESERIRFGIDRVNNSIVEAENVTIYPTLFSEHIYISNADLVKLVEVYTITGQLIRQINYPGESIDTSNLSSGHYILRLHLTNNKVKTVRALKK